MNYEKLTAQEELAAEAIGLEVMRYLKQEETVKRIAAETESRAMRALEKIRSILNDDSLEDPECFQRIEAILTALEDHGVFTTRHDWSVLSIEGQKIGPKGPYFLFSFGPCTARFLFSFWKEKRKWGVQ